MGTGKRHKSSALISFVGKIEERNTEENQIRMRKKLNP